MSLPFLTLSVVSLCVSAFNPPPLCLPRRVCVRVSNHKQRAWLCVCLYIYLKNDPVRLNPRPTTKQRSHHLRNAFAEADKLSSPRRFTYDLVRVFSLCSRAAEQSKEAGIRTLVALDDQGGEFSSHLLLNLAPHPLTRTSQILYYILWDEIRTHFLYFQFYYLWNLNIIYFGHANETKSRGATRIFSRGWYVLHREA